VRVTGSSDADLVRRSLAGEAAAWTALVDRHGDAVYGIARGAGLPPDAAGDVVQDVFVALLASLSRLRRAASLAGWLARTAEREAWRRVRRARASARRERAAARPETDPHPTPDAGLADAEARLVVRAAYDALDARCRTVLRSLILEAEAKGYGALARDLGLRVGSIGALRARCLAALRREVERRGGA
jgi:RNA polymerase sigma factor (sigma-70 family)